jgi:hypothetical protein
MNRTSGPRVLWFVALAVFSACGSLWAVPNLPPFGQYRNQDFSPTITVLESNATRIRLELRMNNLPHDETLDFAQPQPGLWGDLNQDSILVPRTTIYLALAGNGNPTVSVDTLETVIFPVVRRNVPYNTPPETLATLGNVGLMGGVRLVPVTFSPFRYVNWDTTCTVMNRAVVTINIGAGDGTNPANNPPTAFSRAWQRVFQTLVTNWESIPNIRTTAPSHILIVCPDLGADSTFLSNIRSFVQWKEQRGFKVTIVRKSSIDSTNVTASRLRNKIVTEYSELTPRVDFVILVGDEANLPTFSQYTSDPVTRLSTETYPGSYTNELYYSAIEGSDLFPDVFLGRWVVSSPTDAHNIANRSVIYERDAFAADSLRFTKAVCGADHTQDSQRMTVAHVRQMLMGHGYTRVDTVYDENHVIALISDIDNGRSFVNYRGSGWNFGWVGIGFYTTDVARLNNLRKLPIVTGIGCGTGMFAETEGLGEDFMLAGTTTAPKGAALFIGPCYNTHTVINDCLDSTLYRAWLDYEVPQAGPGLATAKMMTWGVLAQFLRDADVLEVSNTMMRQYHLQGDPSLQVYAGTPIRPQVVLPQSANLDSADLTVSINNMPSITADSVNVTAWLNDTNYVTQWITHGLTSTTFHLITRGVDSVCITVTGDSVLTFQQRVAVEASDVNPGRDAVVPAQLELAQNYPNPFNLETTLEFALPAAGSVRLEIYDLLGRKVATLLNSDLSAGKHRVQWHGNLASGGIAGSGIYYCRLSTSRGDLVRKMLLLK